VTTFRTLPPLGFHFADFGFSERLGHVLMAMKGSALARLRGIGTTPRKWVRFLRVYFGQLELDSDGRRLLHEDAYVIHYPPNSEQSQKKRMP